MLKFELLRDTGVLVVEPRGALTAEDFQAISQTVDPFIQENGMLTGLLSTPPRFLAGRTSAHSSATSGSFVITTARSAVWLR